MKQYQKLPGMPTANLIMEVLDYEMLFLNLWENCHSQLCRVDTITIRDTVAAQLVITCREIRNKIPSEEIAKTLCDLGLLVKSKEPPRKMWGLASRKLIAPRVDGVSD